jgi:pimeloyl-ACP methyl ester carboxylesterase
MVTFLSLAAALYILFVALVYFYQERLLYFPLRGISTTPAQVGLPYEQVVLTTSDNVRLSGWFVPAESGQPVLLFFHGNAGNVSHRLESILQFHRLGLQVFIIDYRGYGHSEGQTTETGTYLDAEAAWQYLVTQKNFEPDEIIIFGRSLGGAVAAALAERHPPRGLILESTFTSIPDLAARRYPFLPVRRLARLRYNTAARLPNIHVPLLIIHSREDRVIPFHHAERLFEVANNPKKLLPIKGSHNDGFRVSASRYEATVGEFIRQ